MVANFFDKLSAESIAIRSGIRVIRTMRDVLHVPRIDSDPAANWTAEAAPITPSDPAYTDITATPRKLARLTVVCNELIADSNPDVVQLLEKQMTRALALKLDLGVFEGSGTPPEIRGLKNTPGITTNPLGAVPTNFDAFAAAITTLESNNATATRDCDLARSLGRADGPKEGTGSNTANPAGQGRRGSATRRLYGVPVFVTSASSPARRCVCLRREPGRAGHAAGHDHRGRSLAAVQLRPVGSARDHAGGPGGAESARRRAYHGLWCERGARPQERRSSHEATELAMSNPFHPLVGTSLPGDTVAATPARCSTAARPASRRHGLAGDGAAACRRSSPACQVLSQDVARTPIQAAPADRAGYLRGRNRPSALRDSLGRCRIPRRRRIRFKLALSGSCSRYGRAYAEIVRVDGRIVALWPLVSEYMTRRPRRAPAETVDATRGRQHEHLAVRSEPAADSRTDAARSPMLRCRDIIGTALALQAIRREVLRERRAAGRRAAGAQGPSRREQATPAGPLARASTGGGANRRKVRRARWRLGIQADCDGERQRADDRDAWGA